MAAARVLLVDDDPTITDVLTRYLRLDGFVVASASDGDTALALARQSAPDLVVLDIMLPGIDGLEVTRRLREFSQAPVILLTALGEAEDRIAGFEVGADDYVVKPFSPREVVLRVSAVLRRGAGGPAGNAGVDHPDRAAATLVDGDLQLDGLAREVTLAGEPLLLTTREFDLLAHLMRNPRVVMTREELLREVWGWEFGDTSTVTVHVKRLRSKLRDDAAVHHRIATVWGVGYRYEPVPPGPAGAPDS